MRPGLIDYNSALPPVPKKEQLRLRKWGEEFLRLGREKGVQFLLKEAPLRERYETHPIFEKEKE